MAGRSSYSDADKASVYVALVANDGNVKRVARETGFPESTVRRWRDEFEREGPPPLEDVQIAFEGFVEEAGKTRDFALQTLHKKIPDAKPGELITIIGVLTDKIDRARGMADRTVEHRHTLPSPDEIRAALRAARESAAEIHAHRDEEIEDAEILEPKALPAAK